MTTPYHPRRIERDMPDRADQLAVIRGQKFLTVAMARDNEPYLVTLNYAYDETENCFYLHSATEGRKLEFLRANPRVWGQIVEDRGYLVGQCAHAYRCVMFSGLAEFVDDIEDRRRILLVMIDQLEPEPGELKEKISKSRNLHTVQVLKVRVTGMSGKQGK